MGIKRGHTARQDQQRLWELASVLDINVNFDMEEIDRIKALICKCTNGSKRDNRINRTFQEMPCSGVSPALVADAGVSARWSYRTRAGARGNPAISLRKR